MSDDDLEIDLEPEVMEEVNTGGRPRGWNLRGSSADRPQAKRGPGRPRKDSAPKTPRAPRARQPNAPSLVEQLDVSYKMLAQLIVLRDPQLGVLVFQQSTAIAESWGMWAAQSPQVARVLNAMMAGSGASAVLMAHAPIFLALQQRRQAPPVPEGEVYVTPPYAESQGPDYTEVV